MAELVFHLVRLASFPAVGEARVVITLRYWLCKVGLLLVAWLFVAGTVFAAAEWHVLETPRFTVVSQLKEKETRAWAEEFNQFIEALEDVLKVDDRFLPKLTVVIFDREKDFAAYRPVTAEGKGKEWVAAVFNRHDTWSVAGMADRWEEESMRRLIYQEGVHWLLSADQRPYPMWFSVGMAQLFSTFTVSGDKAKWGDAIEVNVQMLRNQKLLPLRQLLQVSPTDRMFNDDDRATLFYANSWLFVHYLMFGQRKAGHGSVKDFLDAWYGGLSTEEAFQKTFGMDFAAMESALDDYLAGGKFHIYARPLRPSAKITSAFPSASPAAVQVALAKLALGTNGREEAQKHAEAAVRLDPSYADGYKILAWVRQQEATPDDLLSAAEKAVQLGAKDADAFVLLAMAKVKKALSLGGIPSPEARVIANLYEQAINLNPLLKLAYVNLAGVLPSVDQPNDQDVLFLEQGRKLFPGEYMLQLGQAQLLRKKGKKEEAQKILQALCDTPGLLSFEQQKNFQKMRATWDANDSIAQANDLMQQKQYKEALALLDALMNRDPVLEARNLISQLRWRALASANLEDARAALAAGHREEARRLYQSIVEMERAPANLKGLARQALQKMKGSSPATSSVPSEPPAEQ